METNLDRIKVELSNITVDGSCVSYNNNPHWRIQSEKWQRGELAFDALSQHHQLRVTLGTLVADTNWLPYSWPVPESDNQENCQSPQVPFKDDRPEWLNSFLVQAIPLLQLALNATADTVPDRYLRDAYEAYNKLALALMCDEAIDTKVRRRLANTYFVDIRFPDGVLWPLLKSNVDDEMLISINQRTYNDVLAHKDNHVRGDAYCRWIADKARHVHTADECRRRYYTIWNEWFSPHRLSKKELPPHNLFFQELAAYAERFLAGSNLSVLDLGEINQRYPATDGGTISAVHAIVAHTALNSRHDWCPGIFIYELSGSTLSILTSLIERFDGWNDELTGVLTQYAKRTIEVIKSRRVPPAQTEPAPKTTWAI